MISWAGLTAAARCITMLEAKRKKAHPEASSASPPLQI